jgi:hypothetical protein
VGGHTNGKVFLEIVIRPGVPADLLVSCHKGSM